MYWQCLKFPELLSILEFIFDNATALINKAYSQDGYQWFTRIRE